MTLTASRTTDMELIRGVMSSSEIFAATAEDGAHETDIIIDPVSEAWVQILNSEDDLVALYNFHPHNSVTVEIHAQVLPEFRKRYSYETGISALQWVHDHAPQYKKIIAQVPVVHANVVRFIERFGFRREGINRMSYKKNGKLMDQIMFGITWAELKGLLDEQNG